MRRIRPVAQYRRRNYGLGDVARQLNEVLRLGGNPVVLYNSEVAGEALNAGKGARQFLLYIGIAAQVAGVQRTDDVDLVLHKNNLSKDSL